MTTSLTGFSGGLTSAQIFLLCAMAFAGCGLILCLRTGRNRSLFPAGLTSLWFAFGSLLACDTARVFQEHLPLSCTLPFVLSGLLLWLTAAAVLILSRVRKNSRKGSLLFREMY